MKICVQSFSYITGLPEDSDLVFDVRFLVDPHNDITLRPLTGQDNKVGAVISSDPDFEKFFADLTAMLSRFLPCYRREGKSGLTIAIGCTGGQHRSVYVAECLGHWLAEGSLTYDIQHRDLNCGTGYELK